MSRERLSSEGVHERETRAHTEPTLGCDSAVERTGSVALPERYVELRVLGVGGHGEVRRVFDRHLERVVAMKTVRVGGEASRALSARFLSEIKVTAALSHPGVVAIFDHGVLADGRHWYTMPEVRGSTLRARMDARSHAQSRDDAEHRALLEAFARVCETMAYAHSRAVIHRDLKPENIMIGEFGETLVMDWGLARRAEDAGAEPFPRLTARQDEQHTRDGVILGTPSFMAPEQARGELARHGPPTDVYALGVILRQLIALGADSHGAAQELERIAARATADEPEARFADAGAMAEEVRAALDGGRRRERSLAALDAASSLRAMIEQRALEAAALRHGATRQLSALAADADPEEKEPAWAALDLAASLDGERAVLEARWLQSVHGALQVDARCPEAHEALAQHYAHALQGAERERRDTDVARFEELLRAHDRGAYASVLRGLAQCSLVTDPPGARVLARRYEVRGRRRVLGSAVIDLGVTPIERVTLAHGSYLLELSLAGHALTRYPVALERGSHWDGCAPGDRAPHAIVLPREGELDADEVYVPAGYAWTGGDPMAIESLPRRRVWIDGFVAGRFAITNAQYLAFLDDLVAHGREDEALAACPRSNRGAGASPPDALSWDRRRDGTFSLRHDDPGELWRPRGPVVLVSWTAARAYAQWRAARSARPYRLLHELEREKAVRSVDGRCFSWGDHFEPAWTRVASSSRSEASRVEVDAYPMDVSPYGFRQGVGNTRDFCLNAWTLEGPALNGDRLAVRVDEPLGEYRSVRGGAWSSVEHHCRAASRFANRVDDRRSTIGLRIGRSLR